MTRILVIHGPNLNLLGTREPEIYGSMSFDAMNKQLETVAATLAISLTIMQSNHEGEIIDRIQAAHDQDGLIINPASLTHTSIGIRDALASLTIPKIEVHVSNIYQRESFRHHSYSAPVCTGQISGLGGYGYIAALSYFR